MLSDSHSQSLGEVLRTLPQVTGVDRVGIMRQIPFLTRRQVEGKQKADAGHVKFRGWV